MIDLRSGDCLEIMPTFEAGSFDSVVTDPPYELNFMSRDWDRTGIAFRPETWAAVRRVMKPGAYLLAFGGTRTYHRMACAIEDAGFTIKDCLMWIFGSGFPKGKSCLKPAYEPIVLAWNPARKATALNIDKCRVPGDEDGSRNRPPSRLGSETTYAQDEWTRTAIVTRQDTTGKGRYPPNLLLGHVGGPDGCRRVGTRRVKGAGWRDSDVSAEIGYGGGTVGKGGHYADPDGLETVAEYRCVEGCPIAELDRQSGKLRDGYRRMKGGGGPRPNYSRTDESAPSVLTRLANVASVRGHADSGGASRFYPNFMYCPKATKKDRGEGNTHNCVKPHELMKWLVRLITPEGGTIFDPFAGSGSTGKAAVAEGFSFVGIELDPEWLPVAERRIASVREKAPLFAQEVSP